MSTSSNDSIFSLQTDRINVGLGATLAVLYDQTATQNSILLKYFSGGTLEIIGVSFGVTLTAAQMATASGTGYVVGTTEILSIDGPARFYLMSTGATTVVMSIRGKTPGS